MFYVIDPFNAVPESWGVSPIDLEPAERPAGMRTIDLDLNISGLDIPITLYELDDVQLRRIATGEEENPPPEPSFTFFILHPAVNWAEVFGVPTSRSSRQIEIELNKVGERFFPLVLYEMSPFGLSLSIRVLRRAYNNYALDVYTSHNIVRCPRVVNSTRVNDNVRHKDFDEFLAELP